MPQTFACGCAVTRDTFCLRHGHLNGGLVPAVPVSALRALLTDQAGVDQDWHHEWHLLRKRLAALCDAAEGKS
jgi:hypothetical protein